MTAAVARPLVECASRHFSRHHEGSANLGAPPPAVFALLDDQERLAGHMRKPSAMMGGGRMTYAFDEGQGKRVGSHVRMGGSAFGVRLEVEEVITIREPPQRKVWRTTGAPRLLIIGDYEMGFACQPFEKGTRLLVWIGYDLPKSVGGALFGALLAPAYARWCVRRMLADAAATFPLQRPAR